MIRRALTALTAALVLVLALASPAAAVTAAEKARVLLSWTQTPVGSYNAWYAAALDRASWAAYGFDWSTDYCSQSPDQPLGFDFRLSCQRHDFGYRNYKAAAAFPANKSRVDDAFYADLRRRCAMYSVLVRPSCDSLAWTYYNAVHVFGNLQPVSQATLDRAAAQAR